MVEPVIIGDCQLYLGDCLEILPTLGKVDAVVTDPPYGVKMDKGFQGFQGFGGFGERIPRRQYDDAWDDDRPAQEVFKAILALSDLCLIFGGNFFADILPRATHWIVWDKLNTMPSFGDCELIWTSSKRKSVKKIKFEYNGLLGKEEERFHPTQKPVGLIKSLIRDYAEGTVLDPFMGSGTTGVACAKMGRKFIGIEIEPKYFDIACKRIEDSYKQPDMFIQPVVKPIQETMEL